MNQAQSSAAAEKPPVQPGVSTTVEAQAVAGGVPGGGKVYETPVWVTAVRGVAVVVGIVIMALGGYLIHGVLVDPWAFALVCGLFTVIVVAYELVSEKVQAARSLYNVFAVIGLDVLMWIFWLSSMASNAHTRTTFKYSVDIAGCYNDGSAIDSTTCVVYKRDIEKRDGAVADSTGLSMMSAIAGLSALEMLLFSATLYYVVNALHKDRTSTAPTTNVEAGVTQPTAVTSPQNAPQLQPTTVQPQYTGQQFPPMTTPSPVSPNAGQQFPPMTTPSPVPQNVGQQFSPVHQYTGQQMHHEPVQQQYPATNGFPGQQQYAAANELPGQQHMYSPSTSPAPQGMYPPTQFYQNPQELSGQQQQ